MISEASLQRAKTWLGPDYDLETRTAVQHMLDNDPEALEDGFYKDLAFGTGGLRGELGIGSNRMNRYTVSKATQGLADYLNAQFTGEIKVAIAHDSRHMSPEFARYTAEVLSANGIKVYLYSELRPTPLLSYTVRALSCQAGVVITASHNPKEYNGYKVYWEDGAQLVAPHDRGVMAKVNAITQPSEVQNEADESLISGVPQHVEEDYYQAVEGLLLLDKKHPAKQALKVVYTSLHGTGITMIPEALERSGFKQVDILESQRKPDGAFPTVESPNPEEASAMRLALARAEEIEADIILGTDPDTDRVGMGIRDANGQMTLINGNQAAALLIHFLLENTSESEKQNGFIAKTVVTSELLKDIADAHDVKSYDTLTGFKYIAELIGSLEGKASFIGGGEESYGYLVGDFVRDKDAVISSVMLCEMAAWCKSKEMSVQLMLESIYSRFGLYREALVSLVRKGKSGAEEIENTMASFRSTPPSELAGSQVVAIKDYASDKHMDLVNGETSQIGLPSSNVLQFFLTDGSKVTARPSGTEPKIKYYVSVKESIGPEGFAVAWAKAGERITELKVALGV